VPIESFVWELLDGPEKGVQFELSADSAVGLFKDAVAEAVSAGLPWETEVIDLTPSSELLELVRRSHEIAAEGQEGVE
jgi:hypothetical protein